MSREDCGECSHCLMCGCDRDDHYEPDPYDMGNAELDAAGHLNHCGDCEKDNSDLDLEINRLRRSCPCPAGTCRH